MADEVEITTTQRGFQRYGESWRDTYGYTIKVYESSAASGPHVWVSIEEETVTVAAHLNVKQAERLRNQLDTFIEQTKVRWPVPADEEEKP